MATSQNGWPANDINRTKVWRIPGTTRDVRLEAGDAGYLLTHFAAWYDDAVEAIDSGIYDDWGYAERPIRGSATTLSNHASGTALDLNATRHVLGARNTYSPENMAEIRQRLRLYEGAIRWGGDYSGRADEMHFEINASPATVARVARKLRALEVKGPKHAKPKPPKVRKARKLPAIATTGREERVGSWNEKGSVPEAKVRADMAKVLPNVDIVGLQEWVSPRGRLFAADGTHQFVRAAGAPPIAFDRHRYVCQSAEAVTLAKGRFVCHIKGRRSNLPDYKAGLYVLIENGTMHEIPVLNWHLPATVEVKGWYRLLGGKRTLRAAMHWQARQAGRRFMTKHTKEADRAYIVGDTNYHLMRLAKPWFSCWEFVKPRGTHGSRTIDAVYAKNAGPSRVRLYDTASDHDAVVATYLV